VELNIVNEVAALQRLTVGQLRQRFAEATPASNRTWLIKRIAWRLQALAEGDLSERARRRDADLRLNPPRSQVTTPLPEPAIIPAPVDYCLPPQGNRRQFVKTLKEPTQRIGSGGRPVVRPLSIKKLTEFGLRLSACLS
jgi:hypothetical protein